VAINFLIIALPQKLDKRYKLIMSMLGNDISELLSPAFKFDDVELLHNKIIETVCAFEGIFSEKECTFIFHELLHLAQHIHQMGPIHGWWTFSGERAMHFVKQFVKKGGTSFDKSAMRKYDQCESSITEKALNNLFEVNDNEKENLYLSINKNFQLEYDNNKFHLFKKKCKIQKNCSFSLVESNYFLDCLLAEVFKVSKDKEEAFANSSFFRLHCLFENMLGNKKQFLLKDKITITNFKDFLFTIFKENKKIIDENVILSEDELSTAKTIWLFLAFQNNFSIHKKAIIYGFLFTARGIECIETENPTSDYYTNYGKQGNYYFMNNNRNDISLFHNWSTQYSSWCRYKINKLQFEDDLNPSIFYGQLNYFFRFHCPTDNILHGLPIANLVPRNFLGANTLQNPLGVDKITCEKVFLIPKKKNEQRNCFIPLTNFCSTSILIVPFDVTDRPIYIKNNTTSEEEKCYYSKSKQISYILALDLHPNRKYSSFDASKLVERYNTFSQQELDDIDDENSEDGESSVEDDEIDDDGEANSDFEDGDDEEKEENKSDVEVERDEIN
jgi:hypothetical protein